MRGTFANIRIKNFILAKVDGIVPEGGMTKHWPDGDGNADLRRGDEISGRGRAARRLRRRRIWQWLVARLGGEGHASCSACARSSPNPSSASIARISSAWACCRSPSSRARAGRRSGSKGDEQVTIHGLGDDLKPRQMMEAEIKYRRWQREESAAALPHRDRGRSSIYFNNGGILPYVLRQLAAA